MRQSENPRSQKKVLIISLDGATFDVLQPLIAQGYMPNLQRVMNSGIAAQLESIIPPITAPAWTSFMTGKLPGKHGIFDFTRFDEGDYRTKLNNSQHIRSKTLWQILSEKDKKVVVLHLPYTYPPYPVNGVMVAGWDAPTMKSFTYPEELGKEILEIVPGYGSNVDLSLWNYLAAESETEFNHFANKLIHSSENSTKLACHFVEHEPWDVFMVHFQHTDWIQHKLWGYIARACGNPEDRSARLEKVRECYQAFDRNVGIVLDKVAPAAPFTIILSDHGFGPYRGSICPNFVLKEMGHYHVTQEADGAFKSIFKHSRVGFVRQLYRALVNAKYGLRGRQAVKKYGRWADMAHETIPNAKITIDWSRTRAAFVEGSEAAFLYINLEGRGPLGFVQPGDEYDRLVDEIIARFRNLKDPQTGERLLVRVARGKEIYPHCVDGILPPDIVLIPVEGYGFSGAIWEVFTRDSGEEGNHRHNGVLFLQGAELRPEVRNFHPSLVDITPTILHLLGLPVPADMDGRVLEEIFTEPQNVCFEDVDNSTAQIAQEYSSEEAELIEQRLKGLGYVE